MYSLNLIFFGTECKWIRFTSLEWWRLLQSHNKILRRHHPQMGRFLFDFRNIWGLCYCDSWKYINYDMGKCDLISFMLLLYSDLVPWKFLYVNRKILKLVNWKAYPLILISVKLSLHGNSWAGCSAFLYYSTACINFEGDKDMLTLENIFFSLHLSAIMLNLFSLCLVYCQIHCDAFILNLFVRISLYALQLICYIVSWLLRCAIVLQYSPRSSLMLYQTDGRIMHGAGSIREYFCK